MPKWEYCMLLLSTFEDNLYNELNTLGKDGWECFSVEKLDYDVIRYHFERPIEENFTLNNQEI